MRGGREESTQQFLCSGFETVYVVEFESMYSKCMRMHVCVCGAIQDVVALVCAACPPHSPRPVFFLTQLALLFAAHTALAKTKRRVVKKQHCTRLRARIVHLSANCFSKRGWQSAVSDDMCASFGSMCCQGEHWMRIKLISLHTGGFSTSLFRHHFLAITSSTSLFRAVNV